MDNYIEVMGVRIDKTTLGNATKTVGKFLEENKTRTIYTPNTEIIMAARKDDKLKDVLNKGDLVIADGIGIVHASKIKKKPLPERVTGFDLSMKILEVANNEGYSLFLLGGKEGVAEEASVNLIDKFPNIKVAGYHHGYFKGSHVGYNNHEEEDKVIEMINSSKADILFVGFGAPKSEIWMHENKGKLCSKILIGNGGTIDILAGKSKRAPKVFQRLGIEWLYRLVKEPSRIKRQMVLPLFVLLVLFSGEDIVE